ncbi:MAG: TonB family protein [Chromatiales bacterium]|nr:TonB family protein [Chromatiales bacterium]
MDLGNLLRHRKDWSLLLAAALLSFPAALPQASVLRVAQLSGELLVPATPSVQEAALTEEPATTRGGREAMSEPRPLELVAPAYPARAQRLQLDGRVVVCFTVNESGEVAQPAVVSSTDSLFNAPVLEAISASRFVPAHSEDGRPVKSTACRTYRFVAR